jgi:hypothetical protein
MRIILGRLNLVAFHGFYFFQILDFYEILAVMDAARRAPVAPEKLLPSPKNSGFHLKQGDQSGRIFSQCANACFWSFSSYRSGPKFWLTFDGKSNV